MAGRITVQLTDANEKQLRALNRKKGDISNYINLALEVYFSTCVKWDKVLDSSVQKEGVTKQ